MKSRLLALNPIKIQNRLVPKCDTGSVSSTSSSSSQLLENSSSTKILVTQQISGITPITSLKKIITDPGIENSIKVTIHRSNSYKRSDSLSDGLERSSDSSQSQKAVTVNNDNEHKDIFGTPEKGVIIRGRQQSSTFRTVSQVISQKYYNEIDDKIHNGIKKLQELDKRLVEYDNRQQGTPKTTTYKQRQVTNIRDNGTNSQLKETIELMNKKKQEYLQEILAKTRKVKELEQLLAQRNRKIGELDGQIKLYNIKISKFEENTKKYLQDQENHKQSISKLLLEISNLKGTIQVIKNENEEKRKLLQLRLQQKAKEINLKSNQYIMEIKKQFEQKQEKLLKQMEEYREESNKDIAKILEHKDKELEQATKIYEQKIESLKKDHNACITIIQKQDQKYERIISQQKGQLYEYQQQIKELYKKIQRKQEELIHQKQSTALKDQQIEQLTNIQQYYKIENMLVQEKWKQEFARRQQIEMKAKKLQQRVQALESTITKNKNIVQTLTEEIANREVMYDLQVKKFKRQETLHLKEVKQVTEKIEKVKYEYKLLKQKMKQEKEQSKEQIKHQIEKQKELEKQYRVICQKLKSIEEENERYLGRIEELDEKLKGAAEKINELSEKMKETENKLQNSENMMNILTDKHESELKIMKQEYNEKSKEIFKKLTQYYQEKQRLRQEINTYKCKIQQKEKQLNEQGDKLHEIENLIKTKEKQVFINKAQYENLKEKVSQYEIKLKEIDIHAEKYVIMLNKLNKNSNIQTELTAQKQQESQLQNETKYLQREQDKETSIKFSEVLNSIWLQYKKIFERNKSLEKQIKKIKKEVLNIPQKDNAKTTNMQKIEWGDQTKVQSQDKQVLTQAIKTICQQIQIQIMKNVLKCQVSAQTEQKLQQKQTQTEIRELIEKQTQYFASSEENNLVIQKMEIISSLFNFHYGQDISTNIFQAQEKQKQEYAENKEENKNSQQNTQQNPVKTENKLQNEQMMSTNDTQTQQVIAQEELQSQNILLKEEISEKQHIIEVMQSCIEDYKEMVKSMKTKLQMQQKIQNHYIEILDFFEIDPQKTDEEAHQQLLELISVMMTKLEKTVMVVRQLQDQLLKVNEENFAMKEKKKKILREIKRYEQMADRACIENQQLKLKTFQLSQKIQECNMYTKELQELIDDAGNELMKINAMFLNSKYQNDTEKVKEMNEISQTKPQNEKQITSQTRIDNTFDGQSPIFKKIIGQNAIDEIEINEQSQQPEKQSQELAQKQKENGKISQQEHKDRAKLEQKQEQNIDQSDILDKFEDTNSNEDLEASLKSFDANDQQQIQQQNQYEDIKSPEVLEYGDSSQQQQHENIAQKTE